MITWGETQRGFGLGSFQDDYDEHSSIQYSSNAERECIWLGLSKGERMHLTREMCDQLWPVLKQFAEEGVLGPLTPKQEEE